jgi:kinesin family member 6/9
MARQDMKTKRNIVKELTEKINKSKKRIDLLKSALDKKEEERKLEHKARKAEMDFDDDAGHIDEIIDEEELNMLREMKDLKRDYRENFQTLKNHKQEIEGL